MGDGYVMCGRGGVRHDVEIGGYTTGQVGRLRVGWMDRMGLGLFAYLLHFVCFVRDGPECVCFMVVVRLKTRTWQCTVCICIGGLILYTRLKDASLTPVLISTMKYNKPSAGGALIRWYHPKATHVFCMFRLMCPRSTQNF